MNNITIQTATNLHATLSNGITASKVSTGKNKGLWLIKDSAKNKLGYFESPQTYLDTIQPPVAPKLYNKPVSKAEKVATSNGKRPRINKTVSKALLSSADYANPADIAQTGNSTNRVNSTRFAGNSSRLTYNAQQRAKVKKPVGAKPTNRGLLMDILE